MINFLKTIKTITLLLIVFCLLSFSLPLQAVKIHPNAGTTSATFLKLGIGSRAVGMGNSFCAVADDVTALYWNPAGLAQMDHDEIHVTHNESFESIRHDFIGYAKPIYNGVGALALYGLYTPKDLERRSGLNENDPYEPISPVQGYFEAHDLALQVSYSRWIKQNISGGASVKIIQQSIDNESGFGAGLDLGVLYRFEDMPMQLGFAIQHIGTRIKFINESYPLPTNFKLGVSYKWNKKLITALDLNQPIDNYLFISLGSEYSLNDIVFFRLGYRYRWYGLELGDLAWLSAGVGFNFKLYDLNCKLDYAVLPFGVLGNSHRVSLGILFNTRSSKKTNTYPAKSNEKQQKPVKTAKLFEAPPIDAPLQENTKDYTFYECKVTHDLKMATGRSSVYSLTTVCSKSDLISWEGTTRAKVLDEIKIKVGEKQGQENVYKHFIFRNDFKFPINNVICKIKIPYELGSIKVMTEEGNEIIPQKTLENNKFTIYEFKMNKLQSFRIYKRSFPKNLVK